MTITEKHAALREFNNGVYASLRAATKLGLGDIARDLAVMAKRVDDAVDQYKLTEDAQ